MTKWKRRAREAERTLQKTQHELSEQQTQQQKYQQQQQQQQQQQPTQPQPPQESLALSTKEPPVKNALFMTTSDNESMDSNENDKVSVASSLSDTVYPFLLTTNQTKTTKATKATTTKRKRLKPNGTEKKRYQQWQERWPSDKTYHQNQCEQEKYQYQNKSKISKKQKSRKGIVQTH